MMLPATRTAAARRSAFTLLEVLVVVTILVILAGVGVVATTRYLEDAKKSKAVLQCKGIAQAAEAYMIHPANSTNQGPQSIGDLINPSFGTSFLKNGNNDAIDPWGNQSFQISYTTAKDGVTQIPYVHTQAPDGTPISQYGIGPQQSAPPVGQ